MKTKNMIAADMILIINAVLTALMAGLFFAWSVSVMPGFAQLSDREFVSAMQKTNRAIQNPVFFAAFFGAPLFLIISTVLHYGAPHRFWILLAAAVIYLSGTFGVTVFGNVPLNNVLDRFDLENSSDEEVTSQRKNFERRWNDLNTIRTFSSTLSVILLTVACLS